MMLANFRQHLHKYPELSNNEYKTQAFIKSYIYDHYKVEGKEIAETGLLYTFSFSQKPKILIRVDTDALPIEEVNTFEHKSANKGVSHKCGHDGHTTIGVALIEKLISQPLNSGEITVLFQPAEEIGEGAHKVLNDSNFNINHFDFAVALHNIPGAPMHQILWKKQNFTTAVQSVIIRLKGRTSHAAEPLKGKNPSYALAEIIQWAKITEETNEKASCYHLITPIYATLGSIDYGISAGYAELHFTIRSWAQEKMLEATENLTNTAKKIAANYNLTLITDLTAVFAANNNDPFIVDQIVKAAKKLNLKNVEKQTPFPWGEDFGLFTQAIPGAMFGIGAGLSTPPLHSPDYDFPDELIETGANMFYEIINNILRNER